MFIVLMPPKERAELLGEGSSVSSGTSTVSASNLLLTAPGKIDYLSMDEIEHPLPVIQVFTEAQSEVLGEKTLIYAKKSLFSQEDGTFKFSIPDLTNTQKAVLNFKTQEAEGRLIVILNEETIFNGPVEKGGSITVNLPQSSLKAENTLIFQASSPGIAFWATNEVSLEDVKALGEITNLEGQYSKQVFLVSEMEKRNLDRVLLKFQPDCKQSEVGRLVVTLNNNEVYNGIPDCDLSLVPIEIAPSLIKENENTLSFQVDQGRYVLSHVTLHSKLKDLDFPSYYFGVSHELYQDLQNNTYEVRLKMSFTDSGDNKYGDILVNGHYYSFDTKAISIAVNITDNVVQGNNAIKIKPRKTVDVRELRVDLVKN
jgi:hypothetical protein